MWFYTISDDPDVPEKEGLAAVDHYLAATDDYGRPYSWTYLQVAEFLLDHRWQLARALDLVRKAEKLVAREREQETDDNLAADGEKMRAEGEIYRQQQIASLVLQAARSLNQPEQAQSLKPSIEGPAPKDARFETNYWQNRGRLAWLEGRKADALTYYQKALHARSDPPQPYHGRLKDKLSEEARTLWNDMGGTSTAWDEWNKPPAGKARELSEGRWEKPTKTMPAFELADLAGKTWRISNLEGKSVLINVWATWCGPCQAEMPKLQKLYEKVKDRTDLQILSFNIDEDLGLVAPFVKEKGYTFPVLPAYSFVIGLLDTVAIPQNWVLDPKGVWRWNQLGFDSSEANWAEKMLERLESLKGER